MSPPVNVILPDSGAELLRRELALGFAEAGCGVFRVHPADLLDERSPGFLPHLADSGPPLLFSVNFQGLNPLRRTLDILERCGGRAAVWCVDNPWNLLSGVRDPRWKSLPVFITDAGFIPSLKEHGAPFARHLPLASCPELFALNSAHEAVRAAPGGLAPFVFVGRSAFPGKESFFAGQEIPDAPRLRARRMLSRGLRPDLAWWEKELACAPASFWPGKKARRPALGAEDANLAWRRLCLEAASAAGPDNPAGKEYPGLDIFGDEGWRDGLPAGARLHPPVDYYSRLPGIYAAARYSLCLTSLQLPSGLNQRHFDVWTAGGLCLSDATPGLRLFPDELTRPICFHTPADIKTLAERLEAGGGRAALIADWRRCLRERHRYVHRAQTVLDALDSRDFAHSRPGP
ncbi:MAG: DUF3880 domain-containing protein [Desulfovibrio sp.]|jgi:hypothetical protein|nr:DUF3880 domain-containing protein [Desulfovibrio sp.]